MKKEYQTPLCETKLLSFKDVVTTSGNGQFMQEDPFSIGKPSWLNVGGGDEV